MKRRVYHFTVAPAYSDDSRDTLYAVADDDTIWMKVVEVTIGGAEVYPWRQIESLPDAEPKPIPPQPPSSLTTLGGSWPKQE